MKRKIRDLDMHYEEAGAGRPLLLLHGRSPFLNGRTMMEWFEPIFSGRSRWRRLYPDLPGSGRTAVPDWLRGHDDVIDAVLGLMDAIAPGERFAVGGLSWGGYIARGIVHRRPDKVDGLLLQVPDMDRAAGNERRLSPGQIVRHEPAFDAALRPDEQWMRTILPVQTVAMLDDVRRELFVSPSGNPPTPQLDDRNTFSFDPDALAEPCPAPALIVTGRQDVITGYEQAWRLLRNFPRATYAVLDRAGHMLQMEQPALFNALANEWLDRVEEYISERRQAA